MIIKKWPFAQLVCSCIYLFGLVNSVYFLNKKYKIVIIQTDLHVTIVNWNH